MKVTEQRRYALLQAAKDSDYVKKVYGGYLNVYIEAFGEEAERWDLFRVYEGEFPDFTELHKYDGFVVSGSSHDAYGNEYWILKLCFLLQTLDAMEKKILGICFGHQVNFLQPSSRSESEPALLADIILHVYTNIQFMPNWPNLLISRYG